MVDAPLFPPDVPRWLTWGRERIDRIESEHQDEVMSILGPHDANRFFECGRSVKYRWDRKAGRTILLRARFCGFWFCPLCELRRKVDLKRRATIATKQARQKNKRLRWTKVHLTVENVEVADLRSTISAMFKAYAVMTQQKGWPGVGAIRCLEVGRAEDDKAHPHIHLAVATKATYRNGQHYWSEERWQYEWQKALHATGPLHVATQNAEEDDEASDLVEYSQKPPDEDEILWRMRARKQMSHVRRVQSYGVAKLPPRKVKMTQAEGFSDKPEPALKNNDQVVTYSWLGQRSEAWKVKIGEGWW